MIGDLKQEITLQKRTRTADGGGGFTESWQNLDSHPVVSAAVVPLSSREQLRFHQMQTVATHRVTIRFRSDVTADMRIIHAQRELNIVSVTNRGGLGVWLDLLVIEVT